MSRKLILILSTTLAIFLSLKAFLFLLWKFSGDGGTLEITLKLFLVVLSALIAIGFIAGLIWLKLAGSASDQNIKAVGGGVVGLTFLSGICLGGFCISAAVMSSVFSVIYLIPTLIGVRLAGLFNSAD